MQKTLTLLDTTIGKKAAVAVSGLVFYGFVIGGAYPAALAADWLVAAWDQNTGSRQPTPATAAVEEVAPLGGRVHPRDGEHPRVGVVGVI